MNSNISAGLPPSEIFDDLPPIVSLDDVSFQETDKIEDVNNIPCYIPPQEGIDFSEVDLKKKYILGALPTIEPIKKYLNNPSKFWNRMRKIHVHTNEERKGIIKRYFKKKKRLRRNKNIRYPGRQKFANERPRIGGRFASEADIKIIYLIPYLKNKADKGISISKKEFEKAKELYLSKKK